MSRRATGHAGSLGLRGGACCCVSPPGRDLWDGQAARAAGENPASRSRAAVCWISCFHTHPSSFRSCSCVPLVRQSPGACLPPPLQALVLSHPSAPRFRALLQRWPQLTSLGRQSQLGSGREARCAGSYHARLGLFCTSPQQGPLSSGGTRAPWGRDVLSCVLTKRRVSRWVSSAWLRPVPKAVPASFPSPGAW